MNTPKASKSDSNTTGPRTVFRPFTGYHNERSERDPLLPISTRSTPNFRQMTATASSGQSSDGPVQDVMDFRGPLPEATEALLHSREERITGEQDGSCAAKAKKKLRNCWRHLRKCDYTPWGKCSLGVWIIFLLGVPCVISLALMLADFLATKNGREMMPHGSGTKTRVSHQ
jgi:hypothetical protein